MDISTKSGKIKIFNGEEASLSRGRYELKIIREEANKEGPEVSKFGSNADLNTEIKKILRKDTGKIFDLENLEHEIELVQNTGQVYSRPYRRNQKENEIISNEITRMLESNIIRESVSPFASPVVVIKKKAGSVRFCVDYLKLNNITVKKPFPIPNMEKALDGISGGRVFSALDLESEYNQIPVCERDKHKTAFITRDGLFEWRMMLFGLINAPYTFQRIMTHIFKGLLWKTTIVYLDDILVFSRTPVAHLRDLEEVLKRIRCYGLKLNLKKCQFGVKRVEFLGYIVENGQMTIKEEQSNKLMQIKIPRNVNELKSLLGFVVFLRNLYQIIRRSFCLYRID